MNMTERKAILDLVLAAVQSLNDELPPADQLQLAEDTLLSMKARLVDDSPFGANAPLAKAQRAVAEQDSPDPFVPSTAPLRAPSHADFAQIDRRLKELEDASPWIEVSPEIITLITNDPSVQHSLQVPPCPGCGRKALVALATTQGGNAFAIEAHCKSCGNVYRKIAAGRFVASVDRG